MKSPSTGISLAIRSSKPPVSCWNCCRRDFPTPGKVTCACAQIDGSFVKGVLHDPVDRAMVRSIN
jgi:hypothetical protein